MTTGSSPGDAARKTEVIDLADPTNECSLADYPLDVYDCAAGLVSEGPLVCAGNQDTEPQSNCYIAGQSGVAYTLSRPREGAAGIALPGYLLRIYFSGFHICQNEAYFLVKKALDFDLWVILSFRSPFSTLRFSLKVKSFSKQNIFYRSDILHDFSISSF